MTYLSLKGLLRQVAAALFFIAAVTPLTAQTSGVGNINGTVTDLSGAAIPGASVSVLDTDTGITRLLTTNADGSYAATFLQPGHYEIILGGGGFGKIDRKNLVLTVGQTLTVDATLNPASVSTEVVVTSQSPLIDT